MFEESGRNLSLLGNDRWKGSFSHNASLLKLHDFSFTIGYSRLTTATSVPALFGFGVWYDGSSRNNAVTTVRPTGTGVRPIFAGILTRQPHIATGYPAKNNQVDNNNKGLIAKDGFLIYKTGFDATGNEVQRFDTVEPGMRLCINNLNGRFHFAMTAPAGHTAVGSVIAMNPDDQSWVVRVSSINVIS